MFLPLLHHSEDLWLLGHKVTFDGVNSVVIVNDGVTEIDVKADIYSAWKEWLLMDKRHFTKFASAIRAIGGDPTSGGQFAGDIYFMRNGWTVVRDPIVGITGALYNDLPDAQGGSSPWVDFNERVIGLNQVSSLVTAVSVDISGQGIALDATVLAVQADVDDLSARIPTSLVAGRMDSDVAAIQDNAITGDALDASASEAIATAVLDRTAYAKRDNITYDANGFPLSGRERLFASQAAADAASYGGVGEGETDTYSITATPDGTFPTAPRTFDKVRDV